MSLAKKKPDGALAAYLGTTDIPVDVMATFGGVGFLWGHLRAKLGRAAMWGGMLFCGGLALLSRNGYAAYECNENVFVLRLPALT